MRYVSGYIDLLTSLRHFGVIGLIDELRNRRILWRIHSIDNALISNRSFGTSISDAPEYISVCRLAADNDEIFLKFKRCYEYRLVLEHVTRKQGVDYLDYIKNDSKLIELLQASSQSEVGEPFRYSYPGIGRISPTQIRYSKIVRDIRLLFPHLKRPRLTEVGVGNGGLAAQISSFFDPVSYALIDLPEVLALTSKVLTLTKPNANFDYVAPKELSPLESDLFISNYAFSELTKEVQDIYIENLISQARAGYMIYNHIHSDLNVSYSAVQMKNRIPGAEILGESPLTYPGNVLLVWGHDRESSSVLALPS